MVLSESTSVSSFAGLSSPIGVYISSFCGGPTGTTICMGTSAPTRDCMYLTCVAPSASGRAPKNCVCVYVLGETLTATRKDRYRILRSFFPFSGWGICVLLRESQGFLQMSAILRVENPQIFPLENAICCIS